MHVQGQYQLDWTSLWHSVLKERGRKVDSENEDFRIHLYDLKIIKLLVMCTVCIILPGPLVDGGSSRHCFKV